MNLHRLFDPKLNQFALTPFGRTGPLDKAGRALLSLREGGPFDTIFVQWQLLFLSGSAVLFVLVILGQIAGIATDGGETAIGFWFDFIIPTSLAIVLLGGPLSKLFWQIRRLHDLGRSGIWLFVPAMFWAGRGAAVLGGFALAYGALTLVDASAEGLNGAAGIVLTIAAFVVPSLAFEEFVFSRHKADWERTVIYAPSGLGDNRYGIATK